MCAGCARFWRDGQHTSTETLGVPTRYNPRGANSAALGFLLAGPDLFPGTPLTPLSTVRRMHTKRADFSPCDTIA